MSIEEPDLPLCLPELPPEFEGCELNVTLVGEDQVELHWFKVPEESRRSGMGTRLWAWLQANLPPHIKLVTLFAADSDGGGNSDPFWEKQGFRWRYAAEDPGDLDYEATHAMWKGVNGHRTPKPVITGLDQDDEPDEGSGELSL